MSEVTDLNSPDISRVAVKRRVIRDVSAILRSIRRCRGIQWDLMRFPPPRIISGGVTREGGAQLNAQLNATHICHYGNTANGDFLIDAQPDAKMVGWCVQVPGTGSNMHLPWLNISWGSSGSSESRDPILIGSKGSDKWPAGVVIGFPSSHGEGQTRFR